MSEIIVRYAQEKDIPQLTPLICGYLEFYKKPIPSMDKIVEMIKHLLVNPKDGFQLVAKVDDQLVGFVTVNIIWNTPRMSYIALLNDLFVDPAKRKRGTGKALMNKTLEVVKEGNYPLVRLLTAADNLTAQALYDQTGGKAPGWKVYDYTI